MANDNSLMFYFSALVAELINSQGDVEENEDNFIWDNMTLRYEIMWMIMTNFYWKKNKSLAKALTGYHLSPLPLCPEDGAEDYFKHVFKRKIKFKEGNKPKDSSQKSEPPTLIRLQNIIADNCLDLSKKAEVITYEKEASLWDILTNTGVYTSSKNKRKRKPNKISYQRWKKKHNFHDLKEAIRLVLESANRPYGEIFRLGLYPPIHLADINVSHAKSINLLFKKAKNKASEKGGNWKNYICKCWEEKPIVKVGNVKCETADDFIKNEFIKMAVDKDLGANLPIEFQENQHSNLDMEDLNYENDANDENNQDELNLDHQEDENNLDNDEDIDFICDDFNNNQEFYDQLFEDEDEDEEDEYLTHVPKLREIFKNPVQGISQKDYQIIIAILYGEDLNNFLSIGQDYDQELNRIGKIIHAYLQKHYPEFFNKDDKK